MSLTVTPDQVKRAELGEVSAEEFMGIIRTSLPDAYEIVSDLIRRVVDGREGVAIHRPSHMSDSVRGQLLRMFASTSMRGAIEEYSGVNLAFQNCHYVAVADAEHVNSPEWQRFISVEGQLMAQSPELVHC